MAWHGINIARDSSVSYIFHTIKSITIIYGYAKSFINDTLLQNKSNINIVCNIFMNLSSYNPFS